VRVSTSEGLANHTVPESCVGPREGGGEALTGVRIGWVLSRENNTPGTLTLCIERKATRTGAPMRAPGRPGAVVDPRSPRSSRTRQSVYRRLGPRAWKIQRVDRYL
jgi:hypothetical protein